MANNSPPPEQRCSSSGGCEVAMPALNTQETTRSFFDVGLDLRPPGAPLTRATSSRIAESGWSVCCFATQNAHIIQEALERIGKSRSQENLHKIYELFNTSLNYGSAEPILKKIHKPGLSLRDQILQHKFSDDDGIDNDIKHNIIQDLKHLQNICKNTQLSTATKFKTLSCDEIKKIFREVNGGVLSFALGQTSGPAMQEAEQTGVFGVAHWFNASYGNDGKLKIRGSWGGGVNNAAIIENIAIRLEDKYGASIGKELRKMGGLDINIKWSSQITSPEAFCKFEAAMDKNNEDDENVKYDTFKDFLMKTMLKPSELVLKIGSVTVDPDDAIEIISDYIDQEFQSDFTDYDILLLNGRCNKSLTSEEKESYLATVTRVLDNLFKYGLLVDVRSTISMQNTIPRTRNDRLVDLKNVNFVPNPPEKRFTRSSLNAVADPQVVTQIIEQIGEPNIRSSRGSAPSIGGVNKTRKRNKIYKSKAKTTKKLNKRKKPKSRKTQNISFKKKR